jgi:hypothetical protein
VLRKIVRNIIPLLVVISLLGIIASPAAAASAPVVASQYPVKGTTGIATNVKPYINFSRAMDATTINTTNIQLMNGSTAIAVTVSLSSTKKALITPVADLNSNTAYYIVVGSGVKDTLGTALAAGYGSAATSGFTTAAPKAPVVASQYPAKGAINVALNIKPCVTFSKAMDYTTINSSNIQLLQNGAAMPASVALSGTNKAIISPATALSGSTVYYIVVTTAVKDIDGLSPVGAYGSATASRFTTAPAILPTITSSFPVNGATSVPFKAQPYVNFSKAMDSATINSTNIQLLDGVTPVDISVSLSNYTRALITPAAALDFNTTYTLVVGTAVTDVYGNALAAQFTAAFTTDNAVPPSILSIFPADQATGIATDSQPCLVFSEVIDPATLNSTNIKLLKGSTVVKSTVACYGSKIAIITPQMPLSENTQYTINVTTGIQDISGNALMAASTTTFTTGGADLPRVTTQYPGVGSSAAALNVQPCVLFSKEMNAATINSSNILLKSGTVTVKASVALYGKYTALITPSVPLASNTTYFIVVSSSVKDSDGNPPAAAYGSVSTSNFKTADVTLTAQSQYPAANATGVAVNVQPCVVFSSALDAATITTANIQLLDGSTPVSITVDLLDDRSVVITPSAALDLNTLYSIEIGTGVQDVAGRALSTPLSSAFTTTTANISPTVAYVYPADSATAVPLDISLCLVFSRMLDASTVTSANIELLDGSTPVSVSVAVYGNNTVILTPSATLTANTTYTISIGSGIKDKDGNSMQATTTDFTTTNS